MHFLKNNYQWITLLISLISLIIPLIKFIIKTYKSKPYKKVNKYILTSQSNYFVFKEVCDNLNMKPSTLKEVLSKMDLEGKIVTSKKSIDGSYKYYIFFKN